MPPFILTVMTCCAYCAQEATMTIVSNPERVCFEHASEFWTGLLVYAKDRRRDPCMKREGLCTCRSCGEGTYDLRAIVTEAAAPSLRALERFPVCLAS